MLSSLYDSANVYVNLAYGQMLLLVCCVFYILWWAVAFRPTKKRRLMPLIVFLLACAIVSGGIGLCMSFIAVAEAPMSDALNLELVILIAALVFVTLYAITTLIFKRRFTCELFLIVLLSTLEICAADVFTTGGYLTVHNEQIVFIVLAVAAFISLVFYLLYYHLGPVASYVTAMIPLFAEGAAIAVLVVLTANTPVFTA